MSRRRALSRSPTITSPRDDRGRDHSRHRGLHESRAGAGPAVDKRADIWAFGCVLYEMVTGRRAFEGDDVALTLSSVLQREPDWNALPTDVPALLTAFLRRCLAKDPQQRMRDMGDIRLALDGGFELAGTGGRWAGRPSPRGSARGRSPPWCSARWR